MRNKFFQVSNRRASSMLSIPGLTNVNHRLFCNISRTKSLCLTESSPQYEEIGQYKLARLDLLGKLQDQFINAAKLYEDHLYFEAINEFEKVVSITKFEIIRDLTPNIIDIIAKSFEKLAEIYQVGPSEDKKRALAYAKVAHELNPDLEIPLKIMSSIMTDRAPYPENYECDTFNDDISPSKCHT